MARDDEQSVNNQQPKPSAEQDLLNVQADVAAEKEADALKKAREGNGVEADDGQGGLHENLHYGEQYDSEILGAPSDDEGGLNNIGDPARAVSNNDADNKVAAEPIDDQPSVNPQADQGGVEPTGADTTNAGPSSRDPLLNSSDTIDREEGDAQDFTSGLTAARETNEASNIQDGAAQALGLPDRTDFSPEEETAQEIVVEQGENDQTEQSAGSQPQETPAAVELGEPDGAIGDENATSGDPLTEEDSAGENGDDTAIIDAPVNSTPTDISLSGTSVDENDAGATIATLSASDVDAGDTASFSIANDASGLFEVVGDTLKLRDGVSLDHEGQDSYDVTIEVADSEGATYQETVTINVNDVNEGPTDISLSGTSVDENDAGATVATLSASDVDAGDTASFSIASDASGNFEIVGNELKLRDGVSLDHEGQDSYDVTIEVADSEGATYQETVTINVNDVNEGPTDISLSGTSVDENDAGATVATLSASDVDAGDTASFSIANDASGNFEIVGNELKLRDGVSLDHEGQDSYDVTIEVADSEGATYQETVTINVNDVNEGPSDIALSGTSVDENDAGATVATLSASDVDAGDTASFSIANDASGLFEVVGDTLKLRDGVSLDHEGQDSYDVTIEVADSEGATYQETVTINVNDVNEGPTDISLSGTSVDENDAGATVATLSASDVDAGDTASFSIANDASGLFEVVGDTLKLRDGVSLDHEGQDSYDVTIEVADSEGATYQETVTINVNDVNEGPSDIALSGTSVDENDAGATVATLSASDVDAGDTASFSIANDASGLFEVVGDTLKLRDGVSLDHEGQDSYDVTIEVADSEGATYQETVTINVNDVNEGPSDIALSGTSVDENDAGATVATLSASDVDAGDTASFSIANDASGLFEVVGDTLKLRDGVSLDHEGQDSYDVTIEVADSEGATYQETVTINVNDVNEGPTDISLSGTSVDENDAGATVATLSASDVDAGDTASFSIASDASGNFEIVGNELKLRDGVSLDHEGQDSYDVTIEVADSEGATYQETVTINVNDVNEGPTDISLSGTSVDENDAGATVATLSASDVDAGDTASFSIANDASGLFEVVGDTLKLRDGVSLDHEGQDSYDVTIEVADSEGATYQETVTINVNDVNEGPSDIALSGTSVDENDAGATVATLSASDVDAGDTASFSIANDASGLFEVVGDTLKLRDGVSLDHEGQDSYDVTIEVADSEGATYQETVTINVNDVNEGPTDISLSGTSVDENDAGATVATLSASDVDAGDTASFSIANDASGLFEVVGDTLKLRDGVSLDHEGQDSYDVTIEVADSEGATYQETVTINVNDVNEGPSDIALSGTSVDENDAGATVATLSASDVDAGDTASFSIANDASGLFEVVGDTLKLRDGVSLDHEGQDSYDVTIEVADSEGATYQETVTINVNDVNEGPSDIALSGTSVDENDAGATVATLSASDVDAGDTASFSIANDASGLFEVVGDTLKLRDGVSLDHEGQDSYDVTIEVADSEGATYQETVTINVNDVNEGPTDISLSGTSVDENDAGATVATLSASDVDAGDTASFSIANDASGLFEVVGDTLKLRDGVSLDHEGQDSYDVTIEVADSEGATYQETVTINVNDVNEGPSDIALSGTSVDENDAGATVATLSASDVDAGDTASFSIANDASGLFEVVGDTLKLRDGVSLDHEGQDSYDVTIEVADSEGATYQETVTINVNDVNEGPSDIALSGTSVDENDAGATVATLSASDVDAGDTASFSIANDASGLFEVVGDTLKLRDGVSLDHEGQDSYDVTIEVADSEGATYQETVTINVNDVNEGPTDISLSGTSVDENDAGATVATLSASDVDAGDTASFSIANDASGLFEVVGDTLKLRDGVSLDHEGQDSYDVTIEVADSEGATYQETVTINVNDVNEGPSDIALSGTSVDENDAGATVATLSASDVDAGDTASFSIANDASGLFEVVGDTLKLRDGVSLDHEGQDSYDVTIEVADSEGATYQETVTINVNDVNEGPTDISLSGTSVDENDAGATVATLSASDVDAGDTASFSIASDASGLFEVVGDTLKLRDGVSLDHEGQDSYDVTIEVADSEGATYQETVTINVNDVNEGPTDISLSGTSVDENDAGATVATLSASDVDAGDTASFSIANDASGLFEVVGDTLKLRDGVSLDHEGQDSYDVTIEVADSEGATYQETVTINVNDVNEGPTDISLSGTSVDENDAGATVATLSASDVDAGDTASFSIASDASGNFEIVGNELKLRDGVSLDHEGQDSYDVTIEVADSEGATYQETVTINVNDVNEGPTDISLSGTSVDENDAGATVATLSASDVDAGDTASFSIANDASGNFEIVGNELKLRDGVSLDHEGQDSYDVTIEVADSEGATYQETVTINVNDVNEGPTDISLSGTSVDENDAGATVATLSASDVDAGDTASFSIASDASGNFEIVGNELKLRDGVSLDHEGQDSYDVTIEVADSEGATYQETVTINVNDVNEGPTDIALSEPPSGLELNTDGGNSAYLQAQDGDAVMGGAESLTVDMTFSSTEVSGSFVPLVSYAAPGQSNEFLVGGHPSDGALSVFIRGQKALTGINLDDLFDGEIHQLSVTWDNEDGSLKVFVDGQEAYSATNVQTGQEIRSGGELVFGQEQDSLGGGFASNQVFSGNMYDISVYDEVLTEQDLADPVNNGSDHIVAHWPLDSFDAGQTPGALGDGNGLSEGHVTGGGFVSSQTPSFFSGTGDPTLVNENDAGATVATLSASDVDAGDTASFSIASDASGNFEIVGNELKLRDGVSLDHEGQDSYDVTIEVADSEGATYQETVTINVNDVNEGPSDIALSGTSVDENDAGATVATLSASDVDAGDTASFSIASDASGNFEIVGNELKLRDGVSLDHEGQDSYDVTIEVADSEGATYQETVTINVNDVNEGPTDIALSGTSVDENDAGATVATLSASDVDAGDTASFSIANDASGLFEVVGDTLKLRDGVSLDHEGQDSYDVTIEVADSEGATYQETVTINVNDVNEGPTDIALSGTSVDENDAGATVATLSASDVDAGDTASFSIASDASGNFEIVGNELKLRDGVSLDHEGQDSYDVTIEVADSEGATYQETVTINVNDVNEGPTDISLSGTSVDENDAGATVATLSASDVDAGDTASFSIASDASGNFEIVGNELKLRDGVSLDHEGQDSYDVTIEVADSEGATYQETVTINVNDINENAAPTDILFTTDTLVENQTLWSEDFSGMSDGDQSDSGSSAWSTDETNANYSNPNHGVDDGEYEFSQSTSTSNDNAYVSWRSESIDISSQTNLNLSFDLREEGTMEESGSWHDYFEAYAIVDGTEHLLLDQDGDSGISSETYNFADLPTGDTLVIEFRAKTTYSSEKYFVDNIELTGDSGGTQTTTTLNAAIDENDAGVTVANLSAIDPDVGDSATFSIVSDPSGNFEIVGNELKLKDDVSLDYEAQDSHDITIQVDDGNGGTYQETVTIDVNDIYEAASVSGPVAVSGTEDQTVTISEAQLLASTSNPDGATLSIQNLSADNGVISDNGDGTWDFTPNADFSGDVNLTYTVSDGVNDIAATGVVSVSAEVDAPSINLGSVSRELFNSTFSDDSQGSQAHDSNDSFRSTMDGWQSDNSVEFWSDGSGGGYIELNDDAIDNFSDATNIFREVDTTDSASYDLSFDYAPRPGYDETVNVIEVLWDGEVVQTISADGSSDSSPQFQTYNITLTGDGDPSRIEIREASSNDQDYGRGMRIDNVQMTETLDGSAKGVEGEAIELPALNANLTDTDGSETLSVSVAGIPDGAELSDGVNSFTASSGDNSVDVSSWDMDALQVTPPTDYTGDFTLQVNATSTETGGAQSSISQDLPVRVLADETEIVGDHEDNELDGGLDNEVISGGLGEDELTGGGGDDALYGGDGDDTLQGDAGDDTLYGGDGDDIFIYVNDGAGSGADIVNGGSGGWTDAIEFSGGLESLGEFGVDWTLDVTEGSVLSQTDDEITLSEDADGLITLNDGSTIEFTDIEQVI